MMSAERTPPLTEPAVPGASLGSGAAGIALLHIERARAGTGTWRTAHEQVSAATREPVTAHPDVASLYEGAPAVAFILSTAGRAGYAAALNALDGHIGTLTRHRLSRAHERVDRGNLPALQEYDLISGLTGIGAYLLHRDRDPDLLREVLAYLVRLTQPLDADGEILPGWWCGDHPNDQPASHWPGGHGNLGLAHGIAGPLALLSMALRRGVTVSGQLEAITRVCLWLDQWRVGQGPQAWWPGRITRPELRSRTVRQHGPQRPSWCYGTPGLARAQQLAALAVNDPRRQRQTEQTLAGCVTDEDQLAQIHDASLCHGWAGLLHTTWRAAADADDEGALAATLPHLRARLEQHLTRFGPPPHNGFLEGHAGVELVRDTTAAIGPRATRWDACLLLADFPHDDEGPR